MATAVSASCYGRGPVTEPRPDVLSNAKREVRANNDEVARRAAAWRSLRERLTVEVEHPQGEWPDNVLFDELSRTARTGSYVIRFGNRVIDGSRDGAISEGGCALMLDLDIRGRVHCRFTPFESEVLRQSEDTFRWKTYGSPASLQATDLRKLSNTLLLVARSTTAMTPSGFTRGRVRFLLFRVKARFFNVFADDWVANLPRLLERLLLGFLRPGSGPGSGSS